MGQVTYTKDKLGIKHPNHTFVGAHRNVGGTVGVAVTDSMDVASCRMRRMLPISIVGLKKSA